MQLADACDTMGYVEMDVREARRVLSEASHWLQARPDDWRIREARDRLREALMPAPLNA